MKDHLNTIHEIVNAGGDIVQKMDYSAFGVLRSVKDSSGIEVGFANAPVRTSFTYTGREFEPELGMYYYRARYYDPGTGRFLQQDPDPGKLSTPNTFLSKYIYTGNNPVMYRDSSGKIFGFDDAAFLIYAAITAVVTTGIQYFSGQIKEKDILGNLFRNFLTIAVLGYVGDLFFGFSNISNFARLSDLALYQTAVSNSLRAGIVSGGLQIVGNALGGQDLYGPIAVIGFLFYPDFSKDIIGQIFDVPKRLGGY